VTGVWDNHERVEGAVELVSVGVPLLSLTASGKLKTVQPRLHIHVQGVLARAAHQVEAGGLGHSHRRANDDSWDSHELCDVISL